MRVHTMPMDAVAARLDLAVERQADALCALALRIHAHPELAWAERRASGWITELCAAAGAEVEHPFAGYETAFRCRTGAARPGAAELPAASVPPRVAICAEYDALPAIGHACGHNLIAAAATGAFLALHALRDAVPGTIELIGTPAEEGGAGKIRLLEAGAFEGAAAAMMFHPFDRDLLMHTALACVWLKMRFTGKASHAAIAPHEGRSALTACLDTFRLIDGQRVHFRDGVRVHGFITDGGQAVNIIPERAACTFSVRATDGAELARVKDIVLRCAEGARIASGVALEVEEVPGYRDLANNEPLAHHFGRHLALLGRTPQVRDTTVGAGSTDMGDVSHAVPSIHPWLAICDAGETTCHQQAFAVCAASERGLETMLVAAKAMARTAYDVCADAELRAAVRAAFPTTLRERAV